MALQEYEVNGRTYKFEDADVPHGARRVSDLRDNAATDSEQTSETQTSETQTPETQTPETQTPEEKAAVPANKSRKAANKAD